MPSVIKAAVRQLKEKSVRTKQGVFAALQELVTAASDSIGAHTAQMMPGIQAALNVRPPPQQTLHGYDAVGLTFWLKMQRHCGCM